MSAKRYIGIAGAITGLFVIAVLLLLSTDLETRSIGIGLLTALGALIMAESVDYAIAVRQRNRRFKSIREVVLRELRRNYCVADKYERSVLSNKAWEIMVASGMTDIFTNKQIDSLTDCYSAIDFYNQDMRSGNIAERKRNRVKRFISNALGYFDEKTPDESDCRDILSGWAE